VKAKLTKTLDGKDCIAIKCPGCRIEHHCHPSNHSWSSDFENPTINPSLLQTFGTGQICHSWVKSGFIEFLPDTTRHSLRGLHPLPEVSP